MNNPITIGFEREQKFLDYLKLRGIKFIYPSPLIRISGKRKWNKGLKYKPDVYLPGTNQYIEVIGSKQAYHSNKRKISRFQQLFNINFVRPNGQCYPSLPKRYYCNDCKREAKHKTRSGYCYKCYRKRHMYKSVYCQDCGKLLSRSAPYQKIKFCQSCAKKGRRNIHWNGGLRAWTIKDNKCLDCGRFILRKSKYCYPCYAKFHSSNTLRKALRQRKVCNEAR